MATSEQQERARQAAEMLDWTLAEQLWREVLQLEPELRQAYPQLAHTLQQQNRLDDAASVLAHATSAFPELWECWHDLARLCERAAKWPEAERSWRGFLASGATNFWAHSALAGAIAQQRRWDEAEAVLVDGQGLFPNEVTLFADHARIAEARSHLPDALQRWEMIKLRFPHSSAGHLGHAGVLQKQDNLQAAYETLIEAVERFPGESDPLHDLGRLAERSGDWSLAEQCWQRFLRSDDRHWWAYTSLAKALREQGMLEAASSALAVGHARLPNEHAFLGERAKLAEDLCEWQVAAQFWEDLTRRQPTNGEAWAAVARVVRRMGDPHDAERWINEAISLLPQNRAVLAEAVTIAKARGDHNAQLARMELFCCAFPADIDARIALIETYGAGGVYQKAFAEVESMLVSQIKSYRLLSIATSLTRSKNDLTPLLRLWDRLVISGRYDARNLSNDCVSLLLAFSGDQNCSKLIGPIMELPIDLDAADMPPFLHVAIALRSHPYGSVSWGIFCDAFKERKIVIADPLVRHLLSALIETSQDISIIRSTVAELLNLAKPGNWLKDALIVIYSPYYQTPALTAVLKDIFATICTDRRALAQSSDVALYILLLLADALSENNFDRLILAIKNSGRLSAVAPGERDVTSVLARIVEKSMPRSVALPPASISNLRRRLRICICVSGQLRGYLAAFPSWQRLGLWDHDLTLVVHTWKNIGRNIPDNPINAARSFTGEFLSAYKSVILAKGWVFMQAAYPNLVGEILSGQSIEPATLYDFYSAASVQVDDEFAEPFKGMNNFWKMHYKIAQAHQAAVAACPDADLVIRLRPDKAFTKAEPIDWQQLLVESHGHRIIFADKPRHLAPPLWIGDQFAAGTREVMESYSRTFELTEKAGRSACYGFPVEHFGHTNLSCTTFQDGIGVRRFAKIGPESLLSAAHVEPAKIVAALQQDFALRSSQPDDVALLEGATLDQAIAEAVS